MWHRYVIAFRTPQPTTTTTTTWRKIARYGSRLAREHNRAQRTNPHNIWRAEFAEDYCTIPKYVHSPAMRSSNGTSKSLMDRFDGCEANNYNLLCPSIVTHRKHVITMRDAIYIPSFAHITHPAVSSGRSDGFGDNQDPSNSRTKRAVDYIWLTRNTRGESAK